MDKKKGLSWPSAIVIIFIVLIFFLTFVILISPSLYKAYKEDYTAEEAYYQLIREAIKYHTSAEYIIDCSFDEINTYLTGHFDSYIIPKEVYSQYNGTKKTNSIFRNVTESTDYIPERFDFKGLKGIKCKITGAINK